jgi:hypothetical protein
MTSRQRNKTKIAHTTLILLMLFFLTTQVFSQRIKDTSGIAINCNIKRTIHSNKDLAMKIILKNGSKEPKFFYSELVEGMYSEFMAVLNTEIVNFHLFVERKNGTSFREYEKSVFVDFSSSDTPDLDRAKINPSDSLIIYYHVDARFGFEPGTYRIKCRYWNDTNKDGYIESKWLYFRVAKMIHVKHYFDQESFN